MKDFGAAVNIDRDFFGYVYKSVGGCADFADEKLLMYLSPYLESDITDVIVNVFAQTSIFPSRVMTWTGDVCDRKIEDGIPVDYSNGFIERPTKEFYLATPGDPLELIFTETKKAGKRRWLSVRMNDVHGNRDTTSRMRGDMYYEVKRGGMFLDERVSCEFYKSCFDYSHEYVRNMMLGYIDECVEKYEFDMLELDFTREIFCVNYIENPNCHEIMTDFIKSVNKIIKKKRENIGLAVRLCRDFDDALVFGLDVREWIRLGLVDVLIPSPRFRSTDSDMPIKKWKELTAGTDVQVYAGLETFIHERILNNLETVKGFICAYLDEGADMIYLYNYFREGAPVRDMTPWLDKVGDTSRFTPYSEISDYDSYVFNVWRAATDRKFLKSGVRRNVMTFKEESMTPRGERPYRPLPVKVSGKHTLTMKTGYVVDERVTLILGVNPGERIDDVFVDGRRALPLGKTTDSFLSLAEECGAPPKPKNATELAVDKLRAGGSPLFELELYAFSVNCSDKTERVVEVFAEGTTLGYLEFKIDSDIE